MKPTWPTTTLHTKKNLGSSSNQDYEDQTDTQEQPMQPIDVTMKLQH